MTLIKGKVLTVGDMNSGEIHHKNLSLDEPLESTGPAPALTPKLQDALSLAEKLQHFGFVEHELPPVDAMTLQ